MLSPLSSIPDREGRPDIDRDRTPRHSVSHPRDEEDDHDEAARQTRSKMRAIDDGRRRPSLPANMFSEKPSTSETDEDRLDSHSDSGEEGGALDTDMELEAPVHDGASQHTFGGARGSRAWGRQQREGASEDSEPERQYDSYVVDPSERDDDQGGSPVTFAATITSDDDRWSYSDSSDRGTSAHQYASGRRPSLPMAIPTPTHTSGFDTAEQRDREASIATITNARRPSRSLDDDLNASLHQAAASVTQVGQPSSEPSGSGTIHAWQEIDQNYLFDGIMSGSRRSSASFIRPLPAPPKKGKEKKDRKGKGKSKGKGKRTGKPHQNSRVHQGESCLIFRNRRRFGERLQRSCTMVRR